MKPKHLHILQHSLGVNKYGQGEMNRNHFCAGKADEAACRELVALGYMRIWPGADENGRVPNYPYFNCSVTDEGKAAMLCESQKLIMDSIVIQVAIAKEKREWEMREAFCNDETLNDLILRDSAELFDLILRDSAELFASIGGYVAPTDENQRKQWIMDKLHNDPYFVTKVKMTVNLISEYVNFLREGKAE